jgi:flagellin-like hook-associated protein FlgL
MSITGAGSITAANVAAQTDMMNQLNTLGLELSTGQVATTYSGLASQAGLTLSLNAQLSAINGYNTAASNVGTTLSIAQSALTQLGDAQTSVQAAVSDQKAFSLDSTGQTSTQESAAGYLDQIVAALNTQVGNNYIFSGSATDQPAVAPTDEILNGNGAQAGLTTVIQQRQEADLGSGLGRLSVGATGTTVTVGQDGSPFGFQLASVNSNLTGATATGPSGSPPSISVALGATNPNAGDNIQFSLILPDGTTQDVTLTATASSPPGANQFTIGSTPSATATNLQTALTTAVGNLAQTALPAASAIEAANNFFADPPQRVEGPNYSTATSLVNGTSANTVFWYTGENGSTPAAQTATAQVGPSMTVAYGMRATEPAITSLLANVGALAATTFSSSDPNAQASYQALSSSVQANLAGQSGTQSITDIESNLANAQTTVKNASALNTQTQTTLQDMLQGIDGVNQNQVGEQLLTLQNNLSASMSVTARLAQLSLVNYLAPSAG